MSKLALADGAPSVPCAVDYLVWPWGKGPNRLWSVLDMVRFYGEFFVQLGLLPQIWQQLNAGMVVSNESLDACFGAIKHLMTESERLQLPSSLAQCHSIKYYVTKRLSTGGATYQELGRQLIDLYSRATDELNGRCFLMVTLDKVSAYERPTEGWEVQIKAFPSTQNDIEEAQRCFALDRSTACVFHLMRALEVPLKAMAAALGITKHSPTWEAYLSVMAENIKLQFPDKSQSHSEKRIYFTGLEGQLRAIKVAWRNPTMHEIAKVYTPEMAHELTVLVRGFMREAATELSE